MPARKIVRILTRMNIGGPAIHVAILSNHLDFEQNKTCLIVGSPDSEEGDLTDWVQTNRVRLIRLNSLRRAIHPWRDLISWIKILRILWEERPDVIHTHTAKAGSLGRLAGIGYNAWQKPRQRAKLIHTFHGHVLEGYFSGLLSYIFVTIERILAAQTDCLLAVSRRVQDELLAKGIGHKTQWRVIPVGLDLFSLCQLPLAQMPAQGIRCGIIGRLVPIKNHRMFLEAIERLSHRYPPQGFSSVIVGDGPLRQELQDKVSRGKLDDWIRFSGWQCDLRSIYENLDIVCLTSSNEGTPVALIEAAAAGRAVVATDVGGVREILGADSSSALPIEPGQFEQAANGLLVRPGDTPGLVAALTHLIENPDLRQRLGQSGRVSVIERFGYQRLLKDIAALYNEIDPRSPPPQGAGSWDK